jgi:ABC-type spermidine/putrescine transport system permease subunit I
MSKSQHFTFDGGVATYWGTFLIAALITIFSLGFAYPYKL